MRNSVKLTGLYGDDKGIALAAWTSTDTEITADKLARIPEFVEKLAKDKHTVPFEHNLLTFKFKTDLATQIHVMKHRIAVSMSSQSFRWKEQKTDEGYIPEDWVGAYEQWAFNLRKFQALSSKLYHDCLHSLVDLGMDKKRAKESARYFLPYSVMLEYIVTFNFHSFAKFCQLRHDPHAQLEVRKLCHDMIGQVEDTRVFPAALRGWGISTGEIRGWQIDPKYFVSEHPVITSNDSPYLTGDGVPNLERGTFTIGETVIREDGAEFRDVKIHAP